jgi:cytoskeletal protein RodZ
MWVYRAVIISFYIALFVAISAPARALNNSTQTQNYTASVVADLNSEIGNTLITSSSSSSSSSKTFANNIVLTLALISDYVLPKQKVKSVTVPDNKNGNKDSKNNTLSKTPSSQVRFEPNLSYLQIFTKTSIFLEFKIKFYSVPD